MNGDARSSVYGLNGFQVKKKDIFYGIFEVPSTTLSSSFKARCLGAVAAGDRSRFLVGTLSIKRENEASLTYFSLFHAVIYPVSSHIIYRSIYLITMKMKAAKSHLQSSNIRRKSGL